MANEIKATSIWELQKRCLVGYCVYSPSRGKYYDFSPNKHHYSINSSSLSTCDGVIYSKTDAYQRLGIARADGWTDAVVKIIYQAPPYERNGVKTFYPCKIDTTSLTPDLQEFAEWLVNNGYAQIVQFVGDM